MGGCEEGGWWCFDGDVCLWLGFMVASVVHPLLKELVSTRRSDFASVGMDLFGYWFGLCLEDMFLSDPRSSGSWVFRLAGGSSPDIMYFAAGCA